MTSIKPPGGPGNIHGTSVPDPAGSAGRATESFASRAAQTVREPVGTVGNAPVSGSQAVVADLRAGKISPQQAVEQLTDLAVQRSGAPVAMRPAIEARMRELLSSDPLVGELLRQMGAAVATDK